MPSKSINMLIYLDKTARGENIGSPGLLQRISRDKPALVICGHVHEQRGQSAQLNQTRILNVATTYKFIRLERSQNVPVKVAIL